MSVHFAMCEYSIFMHLPTETPTWLLVIGSMKKNCYEQRVLEIEHATFTPLVFSASGGMANETKTFYKD